MAAIDLITDAEHAEKRARQSREALQSALTDAMRRRLFAGQTIDLHERGRPKYLFGVRTTRGNDRGTHLFRVVSEVHVRLSSADAQAATWFCEAVPISPKTGKDMSGAAHGASSRQQTVRIDGQVFLLHDNDDGLSFEEAVARRLRELVDFIEGPPKTPR